MERSRLSATVAFGGARTGTAAAAAIRRNGAPDDEPDSGRGRRAHTEAVTLATVTIDPVQPPLVEDLSNGPGATPTGDDPIDRDGLPDRSGGRAATRRDPEE